MSTLTRIWQRILAWLHNPTLDPAPTPKPRTFLWRDAAVRGMNVLI